jgi:hypothetical protein
MKNILLIICLALILFKCTGQEDFDRAENEVMSDNPVPASVPMGSGTRTGVFKGYGHGLRGNVYQFTDDNNNRILRFDGYNMTQGPDVHVFLSKANNFSRANTIEIASLPYAYVNDSLIFKIDQNIDLEAHRFVLIYCVEYNSLFGYSELQ